MGFERALVTVLLLLVVVPVFGQPIEISSDRRYYQAGDIILIHIKYNGTIRYAISLGPYLRLKEWRLTGFEERPPSITRTVRDPDQYWTVEVLKPNTTGIQAPSYIDIGVFNTTTGELIKVFHRDIIILNVTRMASEYMANKQTIANLTQQIGSLQQELSRQQQLNDVYKRQVKDLQRMQEVSRKFTRYFDYVKFVNKSLSELGMVIGNIRMMITVPVYYDPKQDQWITPRPEDLMISHGRLYVRVPWYVIGNATATNETFVAVEDLEDPNNVMNIFLWNEWFNRREEEAKREYQTLYSWSWIVPFGVAGAIVIGFLILRFWLWRWLKKQWRAAEERGVVPPI